LLVLELNRNQYVDFEKLCIGAFKPVQGFMGERDFQNVVDNFTLSSGEFFPYPILLDVSDKNVALVRAASKISLFFESKLVGYLEPTEVFSTDLKDAATKLYGSDDPKHPGVNQFLKLHRHFVAGKVTMVERALFDFSQYEHLPEETIHFFQKKGWKSIAGFATRNVPHRGHEYLQRNVLEHVDGLFVQATIGEARPGDYTPKAISTAYNFLIDDFYGNNRAFFSCFSTVFRKAGPREALLQAIIRRNYGCTHFIIGRNHSGVGSYYTAYAAHELGRRFQDRLGISIFFMHGPVFCKVCNDVVTEKNCKHANIEDCIQELNGVDIRGLHARREEIDVNLVRPQIRSRIEGERLLHE
jgi:sulfate adenylyltransferase